VLPKSVGNFSLFLVYSTDQSPNVRTQTKNYQATTCIKLLTYRYETDLVGYYIFISDPISLKNSHFTRNYCSVGASISQMHLENIMKKLVYAIAALACLTAAPVFTTPADAQVSIGIGNDGPRLRVGPDDYRGTARAQDRGLYYGRSNREGCREVTVRTRHPDGSVSVRTRTRCN